MIPANNFFGTFSNLVSPEALQEFKIQTSSFAPEYGRSPGVQVELLTRSGTNRYSGSLFEYLRNDSADANDWFANRDALSKPPLRFNNFGGTLGGPVRVPRLYNGRDRTFFFLSIEDAVSVQPQPPVNVVVPSMEARRDAPPAVAAVLNAYPLPNRPYGSDGDADITGLARYVGAYSLRQSQQTYSLRLDHAFFDRLMSFARYSRAPSRRLDSGNAPTIANFELATETLTAGFTHTATPHLINAIRLNGSRQTALSEFDIHGAAGAQRPPEQVFFPPGYSYKDSEILFSVSPSPLMGFGTNVRNDSRQWQIVDNLSYAAGAHRFRTGVDYRWFAPITILPRFIYLFTFPSIYGPTGVYSGTIPQAGAFFDNIPETAFVVEAFSAYAQDTWRASKRLSLTYGLRWELNPAPRVSGGQAAITSGAVNAVNSSSPFVPTGKGFYPTSWRNFAPRLGIGLMLRDGGSKKTMLRVGAGKFFDLGHAGFEGLGFHATTLAVYENLPLGSIAGASPSNQQTLTISSGTTLGAASGYRPPYTWQWNATVEQSIGQQTFSAGYVGAAGRHLVSWTQQLEDEAIVGSISLNNNANSSYHALQLQFNRRFSSRLHMLLSYTWSHSIDNVSNDTPSQIEGKPLSLLLDPRKRGSSDFDIRQSLNGSVIAALPSPRSGVAARLLRNWTANGIFFARTAVPTDVLIGGPNYRPDLVPGQPLYLYGPDYPGGKAINRDAFATPPDGLDGNLGRNALRGLGAWQIDFALHREFPLAEKTRMQIRAEAFNILNHPNFSNPGNPALPGKLALTSDPGFGSASQMLATGLSPAGVLGQLSPLFQIGGPRAIQIALRIGF